jgi:hypothetical protein
MNSEETISLKKLQVVKGPANNNGGSRGMQEGGGSILSDYSFSPQKKHHHLVIHSGLTAKGHEAPDDNEDARTEEVTNERVAH